MTIIVVTILAFWACGNARAEAPDVQFRAPTPADGATVTTPTVQIEAAIGTMDNPGVLPDLNDVTFQWNGTDYKLYDSSLVLMFNFNNVYGLGEDYQLQPELGVRDLSLSGNDGYLGIFGSEPLTGVPSWTESAIFGGAFIFDAAKGESILVPHDPSLNPGAGDFAIVLWILPQQNVDSDIMRKGSTLTSDDMWYKLEHSASGNNKISLNFNTNGTDATLFSSDSYADQNWHFVLAQRRGDLAELWIDGVLDGTAAVTGEIFNDANMAIGSKDTQNDDFFNGMISELRIYMKSFSVDEIQVLYDSMLGVYPLESGKWFLETMRDGLESGDYIYSVSATNPSLETYTLEQTVTVALPAPPDVTLISPANGSVSNDSNVTFTVSAADPIGLYDATLYIGTPEQVATFSGPAQTDDAQISADSPNSNYGGALSINVDALSPHAHAVVKFPNLIGSGPGQVPLDSTVVSATLQVNCTNLGAMMEVYRLTSDWDEGTVTWNSPWTSPGGDYSPAIVVNGDCTATGLRTIDITEFVQAWSDGTANCGILLADSGGTDGIDFDSSESGNPPVLTVVYAGDWQAVGTETMSGTSDTAVFANVPLEDMNDYIWNCLVSNTQDPAMLSWAPENFYLSIDGQTPDEPVLAGPADGASGVTIPATLEVTVSDPQTEDSLDVTFYGRKRISTEGEFTIVVLPDTQKYVLNGTYSHIFIDQIQWIIDNKDALNIVFVTQVGDIVDTWNSTTQWEDINAGISLLDGVVPYGLALGDHDHFGEDPPGSTEVYELYFPASRFADPLTYPYWGGSYAGNFGGSYEETYPHTNNNNYQLLTIGGEEYIFVHLDFCPSQDEIDWVNGVLTTYSDRKAILTTHGLLDTSANYYGSGDFWLYPDGTSNPSGDTSRIWTDLIRNHENLQLVLCGHMHGESRRTDNNLFGNPVHQLMANYQSRPNGGNGWLRIMRFVPSENKIYVQTYSPYLNSETGGSYETDGDSQFELDMPMSLFGEIGTNLDVANNSNTSVNWTDLAEQTEYEWYATVTDSTDRTSTGPVWSFTSGVGNQPPTVVDDSAATDEDTAATIDVLSNDSDPESDPFAVDSVTQPSNGTVVINSGTNVTYTPDENFNGVDTFTYKAADATNSSDPATVTVTVNAINDAPLADDQAVSAKESTAKAITLTGSDVDQDVLTFSVVTGPTQGELSGTAPDMVYTPTPGYLGLDSFTFKANDGTVDSGHATVTITVSANNVPVANPDSYSVDEDETLNVAAATGVLLNDADADSDPLTALPDTDVSHGNLTLNPDGSFSYSPNSNYNGSDSFTYKANDGTADSLPTTVSITVNPINDNPVANNDPDETTDEDTPVTINVLGNDTDADGDSLEIHSVTQGANGSVTIETDNTVTYSPNANYSGPDTFTYIGTDGTSQSNSATVSIMVRQVNDPPTADDDSASTMRDVPVDIDVLSNDDDIEGSELSVGSVTQPAHGSVVNNNTNVTYTPSPGYVGDDSFTYTASDGAANSNLATVSITISAPGPTSLFTDGFESGNLTVGGWSSSGSVLVKEPAAFEGVYGVQIGGVASITKTVSTAGYGDIHLKYARKTKGLDSGEALIVEWSPDGITWNDIVESTSETAWAQRDILLGTGANDKSSFTVRFRTTANKTNEYASVDSVEITGTPAGPDLSAPVPNPMTWATTPFATGMTSISMTASTASDASGVEYFFDCLTAGGHDSGWQDSPTYTDTGLAAATEYTYTVTARDKSPNQNQTLASAPESATTDAPDTAPPTPNPLTWATPPQSSGSTSITMTAGTASDPSGVEYYFECTAGGGHDSGWQDSSTYIDTGLSAGMEYTYRVQARDKSPAQNVGGWSSEASASPIDVPPAAPTGLSATAGDGQVSLGWNDNGETDLAGYNVYRATVSGGPYTQLNGTLLAASDYLDLAVNNGITYFYVVTAVDSAVPTANESGYSSEVSATPSSQQTVYISSIDMLDFVSAGKNIKAVAGITLNVAEAGATVSGDWYYNDELLQSGAAGITDAGGYTEITSVPEKANSGDVFKFVVRDVVLAGYIYEPGDVTENSITVP